MELQTVNAFGVASTDAEASLHVPFTALEAAKILPKNKKKFHAEGLLHYGHGGVCLTCNKTIEDGDLYVSARDDAGAVTCLTCLEPKFMLDNYKFLVSECGREL